MKKFFTLLLVIAASVEMSWAFTVFYRNFTVTASSGGFENQGADKLVDGKYYAGTEGYDWTKWSADNTMKSNPDDPSSTVDKCWWVDFHSNEPIPVHAYTLTSSDQGGYNPTSWTIYAKYKEYEDWEIIEEVANNNKLSAYTMTDISFDLDKQGSYRYFRFKVTMVDDPHASAMQLCEFRFIGEKATVSYPGDIPAVSIMNAVKAEWEEDEVTNLAADHLPSFKAYTEDEAKAKKGLVYPCTLIYDFTEDGKARYVRFNDIGICDDSYAESFSLHNIHWYVYRPIYRLYYTVNGPDLYQWGLNLCIDPYTIDCSELPPGTLIEGSMNTFDALYGYYLPVFTIPVTAGIYKVMMGTCALSHQDGYVKTEDGLYTYATLATNNGTCYHNNTIANVESAIFNVPTDQVIKVYGAEYTPFFSIMKIADVPEMTANARDPLNGKFTINVAGDQVVFSKGNLQAATSYIGTNWMWFFAPNQWSYVGNASANTSIIGDGKVSVNDTVDLFGWSTDATKYGINKSTSTSDYFGNFEEWGNNIGEGWYTLSKDEWEYLFHGRDKADELFGFGSVNGINGIIILPDDWTLPTDAIFNKAKDNNLVWQSADCYYYNSNENNFSHNTYTAEQWDTMEKAGAVFLPAAGSRDGTVMSNVGEYGLYWSSSPYDVYSAHYMFFDATCLFPQYNLYRYHGLPVRLVKPAPSGATGMEQANSQEPIANSQKLLRDGQLLILRDGKMYNVMGVEIR